MARPHILCLILLGALGAGACGSSRLVQRNQFGGVLALIGFDRTKAMQSAHLNMASHCGPGAYTIVQEGETVTGSQTRDSDETRKTKDGKLVRQGGSSTTNTTEWRVHYQCAAAPAGPVPAAFTTGPSPQPYGPVLPQGPVPGYPPPQQPYPQPYPQQPYPQQPGYPPQQPYPGQPAPQAPAPPPGYPPAPAPSPPSQAPPR